LFTRSLKPLRAAGSALCLCALTNLANAGNPTLPTGLGATPLENAVFNAVVTTCLKLDVLGAVSPTNEVVTSPLTTQQQDLHDQCHGIASAALTPGASASQVLGAIQQISGNEYSSQGSLATRVVGGQFTNISGRLNVLRLGAQAGTGQLISFNNGISLDNSSWNSSNGGDGFAPNIGLPFATSQQPGALLNTAFNGNSYTPVGRTDNSGGSAPSSVMSVPPNPLGVYVQGSYNSGHHDATENEDPFNFHAASVTAGLDYNFGGAVLGVSVGYDDYDAGFRQMGTAVSGGGAQVKSTSGSIYGSWFNSNWNFNGIATYGRLQTNLSRVVTYDVTYAEGTIPNPLFTGECTTTASCTVATTRTLQGDPNGNVLAIGATAGYTLNANGWDISPSLSGSYRRATINSFTETDPNPPVGGDGLALSFDDQNIDSLRSTLGLDLSRPVSAPFGVVTPLLRLEWDHEFKTGVRYINAHYAATDGIGSGCLSCFSLPTDPATANYAVVGAGVSILLARRLQAFVYDEVLVGESNYSSNSIAVGLRGQF